MRPLWQRPTRMLALTLLLPILGGWVGAHASHAQVHWHKAGASVYGQPCDPWEIFGNHDNLLSLTTFGFAELDMGTALGGLPYLARIRVKDPISRRSATLRRVDIGRGGGPIRGVHRRIDILWTALKRLLRSRSSCSWTGVVLWRRLR